VLQQPVKFIASQDNVIPALGQPDTDAVSVTRQYRGRLVGAVYEDLSVLFHASASASVLCRRQWLCSAWMGEGGMSRG
jgi:hypothetical protein